MQWLVQLSDVRGTTVSCKVQVPLQKSDLLSDEPACNTTAHRAEEKDQHHQASTQHQSRDLSKNLVKKLWFCVGVSSVSEGPFEVFGV